MSHKSNAFSLLESFSLFVANQFDAQIKIIRSDNGQEFGDNHAMAFYNSKGIIHQTSCVDTPQQNGIVERKHKQLLEVARALMFQSKVPLRFWGDCVLTGTYLVNRLPNSAINFKTPYEVLFSKPPSYEHLKVFGCLCFISTLRQGRTKFEPRAHPCIFLGYPVSKKAYKVYNLVTKTIHYSRDIVFHEQHFPYLHISSSNTVLPNTIFLPTIAPEYPPSTDVSTSNVSDQVDTSAPSPDTSSNSPAHDTSVPSTDISQHPSSSSVPIVQSQSLVQPQLRRSSRLSKTPIYLQDYMCPSSVKQTTPSAAITTTHWCNLVHFSALTSVQQQQIDHLDHIHEPTTFEEAATSSQ